MTYVCTCRVLCFIQEIDPKQMGWIWPKDFQRAMEQQKFSIRTLNITNGPPNLAEKLTHM